MTMNKIILLVLSVVLLDSCSGINCDQLPKSYASYYDAAMKIRVASFKIHETINTSKSSWIRGASYYSCDENLGFLIIQTDNQEYIHANVPVDIWNSFKLANSFGRYYNYNIKYKYSLQLNK